MQSNNVNLNKLTKRPIQYWFEDGIGEFVMGILYFIIGINFCIQATVISPQIKAILSLVSVFIIGGGVIITRKLIGRIKELFIYPRTGYVSYTKQPRKAKITISIVSMVAVAVFAIFLRNSSNSFDWTPIVIGVICGLLMLYQAFQTSVFRLYVEAILAILIGIVIATLNISGIFSSGIFFISFGLILIIGGGCAFVYYLKKTTPIEKKEF
ncbi:MAG: hypothetical protein ACK2U1_25610 [Anaerolineales bacterium]|jgi:hypothetical protein